MNKLALPTYPDVVEAHQRILPYLNKTPILIIGANYLSR